MKFSQHLLKIAHAATQEDLEKIQENYARHRLAGKRMYGLKKWMKDTKNTTV